MYDTQTALRKKLTKQAIVICYLCWLAILTINYPLQAAVFACPSANGTSFQDTPCEVNNTATSDARQRVLYPLSIHASWFDRPDQAEDQAYCDRRGCECGDITKSYRNARVQAVADALYLDGSWHRYNTIYKKWITTPSSHSNSLVSLRTDMLEAACEIMVSQQILRNYAEDVVAELTENTKRAENRGFDVEEPCLQGVQDACSYYQSVRLLGQLRRDAASLERVRGDSTEFDVVSSPSE